MSCDTCTKPHTYRLTCIDCCARLVLSARPSKEHAVAMLEAVGRHIGSPPRDKILARVRELMEAP